MSAPASDSRSARAGKKTIWRDGRWLAVLVLAAYFGVLFGAAEPHGWWKIWRRMGVIARSVPFEDLRTIPAAAESAARGRNPYLDDIGDLWQRRLNYPRVWLRAYDLGLTMERVPMVGWVLGGSTLAAAFFIAGPVGLGGGLAWAAILCSPAVMLGIERANIDLVIFCVLTMALALWRRPALSGGLVLAAGIGKLYPVGGLLALLRRPSRRALIVVGAGLLVFVLYLALTADDLFLLNQAMPHSVSFSYGCAILFGVLGVRLSSSMDFLQSLLMGWAAALVVLGLALRRGRRLVVPADTSARAGYAFLLGAGAFLVSFLPGTAFDYRCIFTLLCVPFWLATVRGRDALGACARAGLACMLLYLYWNLLVGEGSLARMLCKQLLGWLFFYEIAVVAVCLLWPAPRRPATPMPVR